MLGKPENPTDLNSLESTLKLSGTDTYNYSVDALKKAAFIDELQLLEAHQNFIENRVDKITIICYLKDRIDQITKRYK
jgi:hypothetical protein